MKLLLKGARVMDPMTGRDKKADVLVQNGLVARVGELNDAGDVDRVMDITDKLLIPGVIDLNARLREPGAQASSGSVPSELAAALAGGITSVVLPPDMKPPLDEPGLVEMLQHRTRQFDNVRVYPLAALTVGLNGKVLTEMGALARAGCIGFSQADEPILNTHVLFQAMQYASSFGHMLWLRAQDPWLTDEGVAAEGAYASRLGLAAIPEQAETVALDTLLELQKATGVHLHISRLSSAAAIERIRQAKAAGQAVTCDISVNNLHLVDLDIGYYDSRCRLEPPLRGLRDRTALRAGLADGTIDAVCSDHTPVDTDGKFMPFADAAIGATGLELLLSLTLKWAQDDRVDLMTALSRLTAGPAGVLQTSGVHEPLLGRIEEGAAADLAIVDLDDYWVVDRDTLLSRSHSTPFEGQELPARVWATIARGRVVWEREAE